MSSKTFDFLRRWRTEHPAPRAQVEPNRGQQLVPLWHLQGLHSVSPGGVTTKEQSFISLNKLNDSCFLDSFPWFLSLSCAWASVPVGVQHPLRGPETRDAQNTSR